jgi:hypothetical protein
MPAIPDLVLIEEAIETEGEVDAAMLVGVPKNSYPIIFQMDCNQTKHSCLLHILELTMVEVDLVEMP